MTQGYHICILANVGAGKSTLSKHLVDVIKESGDEAQLLLEPASKTNIYLQDYYKDQKRLAFEMNVYLLSKRYRQQKYAEQLVLNGISVVQDASVFADSTYINMFERLGIIDSRAVQTYYDLFKGMTHDVLLPSVVVYLKTSTETNLHRIAKRMSEKEGRKCEAGIDPVFLETLGLELDSLILDFKNRVPVIEIPWDTNRTSEEIHEFAKSLYSDIKSIKSDSSIFSGLSL